MSKKGKCKRLSESERSDIITKLMKPNPPSKRALAREYNVSETAIRKTWEKRDEIQERCAFMSEETRTRTFRASVGQFAELENILYLWINSMRCANLPVPPSLAIVKAKEIAVELSIPNFKASWQWLNRFRTRRGLQKFSLFRGCEGAEINPELNNSFEQYETGSFKEAVIITDDDESDDHASSPIENDDDVEFHGFDVLYDRIKDINDQLLCADAQAEAGDAYEDLKSSFDYFQKKLKLVTLQSRHKKRKSCVR